MPKSIFIQKNIVSKKIPEGYSMTFFHIYQ